MRPNYLSGNLAIPNQKSIDPFTPDYNSVNKNVGIGTMAPTTTLHVKGNALIESGNNKNNTDVTIRGNLNLNKAESATQDVQLNVDGNITAKSITVDSISAGSIKMNFSSVYAVDAEGSNATSNISMTHQLCFLTRVNIAGENNVNSSSGDCLLTKTSAGWSLKAQTTNDMRFTKCAATCIDFVK